MIRRVMLVDDEPLVVEGLVSVLGDRFDESVWLLRALGPADAIDSARATRIDVLVTDIEMPSMNGLELHKHLRSIWPRLRTVFLTAHSKVEYIRDAMRSSGVDYVLKSEDDSVLVAAVERALDLVNEQQAIRERLELAQTTFERFGGTILEELCARMLHGADIQNLAGLWREIPHDIDPESETYVVLTRAPRQSSDSWHGALNAALGTYVGSDGRVETVAVAPSQSMVFLQLDEQRTTAGYRFITETLDLVQDAVFKITGADVSFAVSATPQTIQEVPGTMPRLSRALDEALAFGGGVIVGEKTGVGALESYDHQAPAAVVSAERYIREHLDNQLSIAAVADHLDLNPSYLSRLYRETRGRTIQSFLIETRTRLAKILLQDPDMRIAEVARAVGLSTPSYFAAFFRKHAGLSPHDFRARHATPSARPSSTELP